MIQKALTSLLLLAIGYLLGAIPSGYLAGRLLKGIDLRDCGSGSTGATNVLRNVGKGPALVVFLIDVSKGALAVLLAKSVGLNDWLQVLAGLSALAGHTGQMWPASADKPVSNCSQSFNPTLFASSTASAPLPTSIRKTTRAGPLPTLRSTLVAPVLPEPQSRRSMPLSRRPARYPLGMAPSR